MGGRHRLEEEVGRRPAEVDELRLGERERPVVDQEMAVGRRDVDVAGVDAGPFERFLNVKRGPAREDLRQQAAVPRVEVLDDEHGRAKGGRQRREDGSQGCQPARRGSDRDKIEPGHGLQGHIRSPDSNWPSAAGGPAGG